MGREAYQSRQTALEIRLPSLDWRSGYSLGDKASQVAARLLRGSGCAQAPDDRHSWQLPSERYLSIHVTVRSCEKSSTTYVFLLFMDMPYLEPDILFGQRTRRIFDNILEALSQRSARWMP